MIWRNLKYLWVEIVFVEIHLQWSHKYWQILLANLMFWYFRISLDSSRAFYCHRELFWSTKNTIYLFNLFPQNMKSKKVLRLTDIIFCSKLTFSAQNLYCIQQNLFQKGNCIFIIISIDAVVSLVGIASAIQYLLGMEAIPRVTAEARS